MNILLPPELKQFVANRVQSRRNSSASEVIHEALRLLEARDLEVEREFARLHADVQAGLRELDAGAATVFDDVAVERIKQAGRIRLALAKGALD